LPLARLDGRSEVGESRGRRGGWEGDGSVKSTTSMELRSMGWLWRGGPRRAGNEGLGTSVRGRRDGGAWLEGCEDEDGCGGGRAAMVVTTEGGNRAINAMISRISGFQSPVLRVTQLPLLKAAHLRSNLLRGRVGPNMTGITLSTLFCCEETFRFVFYMYRYAMLYLHDPRVR
jgi:hypothetical protein